MFHEILVVLCDPERSQPVIQQAIWLAGRSHARVVGLYVVDQEELIPPGGAEVAPPDLWRAEVEPELRATGQRLLDELAGCCAAARVAAETRLVVGSVARTICRQARTADLVVTGRCGDYARRVEAVVRQCNRPVLVAANELRGIDRILVAYDGSPRSAGALTVAARLAVEWQAPLLVITIAERKTGHNELEKARTYLQPYGLPEKALLLEGTPAVEIVRTSAREKADLIVMGGYCHNHVQELFFGGTLGQVLKKADRPVLVGCGGAA